MKHKVQDKTVPEKKRRKLQIYSLKSSQDRNLYLNIQFSKTIKFQKALEGLILMINSSSTTNQEGYYFLLPHFPTGHQMITPLFPSPFIHHFQFYRNPQPVHKVMNQGAMQNNFVNQDNSELIKTESLESSSKIIRQKKGTLKGEEYNPKEKALKHKRKKVYEKDKQRNVLPNALSKLFFFLKSPGKSQNLLNKIIKNNLQLGQYVSCAKFYSYHNFIKSKMERFMTIDSLGYLFQLNDPEFCLFSLEEQLAIIKINGIMVRNFIKNHLYFQLFLNSSRSPKNKINSYMKKYRLIESQAIKCLQMAKNMLDFSPIDSKLNQ